ncbi:YkgJ family cysteine cluster protein [Archaeoglobales archaeon]|nr:MAG: YkgJ family cysteine cluster protein [Archaeoglobales archaeon]
MIENSEMLTLNDKFKFLCHKNIECFNKCCYDLNLFLTPYDVIRLKNRLKLTSTEFLKKYTTWHIGFNTGLPVVVLKMRDDLTCPFVSDDGCLIYKDRPSSCRLYPLARIKLKDGEYYYIVKEDHCKGFDEDKEWTVREWLEDQEVNEYNKMNDLFMGLISSKYKSNKKLDDKEIQLFYMACFDVDRFRGFVAENNLLNTFNVDIKDDIELMKFGINWLRFTIFREDMLKLKE